MVGTQQLLRRLPNEISISFLGKEITPAFSAKDLGIILDNNLTYAFNLPHHAWPNFVK